MNASTCEKNSVGPPIEKIAMVGTASTQKNIRMPWKKSVQQTAKKQMCIRDRYDTLSQCLDVTATRAVTYTEPIPFDTVTQENENQDQTYRETVQPGCAGTAQVTAEIETVDGEERTRTILARTVLRQATDEIVEVGTRNVGIGTGEFAVPLNSDTCTSAFKYRWGRLHGGVDLAVDEGTPVYAADNGKVIVAEDSGNGYGNYIILDQDVYKRQSSYKWPRIYNIVDSLPHTATGKIMHRALRNKA